MSACWGMGNLDTVTLPGDIAFAPGDTCHTTSISIATAALAAGNYVANVNMTVVGKDPGTTQVSLNEGTKTIHFRVTAQTPLISVSCYLTDSSGNLLTDCAGVPVTASGSSDGRFAIVVNKKNLEVATNPGQFYYNFIWRNTGTSALTVSVNFFRVGVAAQGAQALHSWVTNRYGGPITPSEFDATNEIGLPSGSDDNVGPISVGPGDSLIVTYHLEWTGIGGPAPLDCAASCATANQIIRVTGTVSGTGISTQSCTTEARGYKK